MLQESDDIYLLTEVASLYYEKNCTQEQIARMIGISRSGVSRLLNRSRELGLVDIQVHHPLRTSALLRDELIQRFGLQDAQVLLNSSPDEQVLPHVGSLAAQYLDRQIQQSQTQEGRAIRTVGIAWGQSLLEVLKTLRPRHRLPLNFVQLMGSVDAFSLPEIDGPEIIRRFADAYGARCYRLYAPMLVNDAIICRGLLCEQGVQRSFQMMERMDLALVGIGGLRLEASTLLQVGYVREDELQEIRHRGAVGDICGYYVTLEGKLCATDRLNRMVTVPFDVLYKTPSVIAVAAGIEKTEAILGVLRTKLLNVLITDETCARAVLQLESLTS